MKKFLENLYFSFFYDYKKYKTIYVIGIIAILIGFIIGIILAFSYGNTDYVLSLSNKNYTDYVNGVAELNSLFVENFKWIVVGNLICIIFSFTIITFCLSLLYIAYQSALMAITIISIIQNFRFVGVINSLLFILPFNLIIIICMGLISSILFNFFRNNYKTKTKLFNTREDRYIFFKICIIFLLEIMICLIVSYFVPLTLKSLIIVSF